jgi:hypothetical protein
MLSPRLDPPGNDSNAPFPRERSPFYGPAAVFLCRVWIGRYRGCRRLPREGPEERLLLSLTNDTA